MSSVSNASKKSILQNKGIRLLKSFDILLKNKEKKFFLSSFL